MPDYPRYSSKESATTQQPSFLAPKDTSGEVIAEVGKMANTTADVALKWSNAVDTIQKTTATANFKSGMADILNRAQNDPNYNNSDQYLQEIDKLKKDNLNGFSSKAAENETLVQFNYESKVGQIQLQNLYKKKMIDVGQMSALKLIDMETNNPDNGSLTRIENNLNQQVASGVFSHEEAYKQLDKAKKTIVGFDIANDPAREEKQSDVLSELKKGDKGKYAYLSGDQRLDAIKSSQQRIFNNNQTFKRDIEEISNQRANDLIEKFANGTADLKDIENELSVPEESGGMKRSTLLSYQKAIISGIQRDLNRMLQEKTGDNEPTKRAKMVKEYNDLIDNFVDDKTDQTKAKEMLASAYADGIISSSEQKFLNELKQNAKDIEWNRSTNPIVTAIKGVKDYFKARPNSTDEEIARKVKTLVNGIVDGNSVNDAVTDLMRQDVFENHPDVQSYPKEGKLQYNPKTNTYRRVFPDGRIEEVQDAGKSKNSK